MRDRGRYGSATSTSAFPRMDRCADRLWRCVHVLALVLVLVDGLSAIESKPMVETKWGQISGKWSKTVGGRQVANFLGIPYALPPLGDLRFKSPQRWNHTWEIRDATTDGSKCIQFSSFDEFFNVSGSEDCLFVNIFVPKISDNDESMKLPVLVYVHGGSYVVGSGNTLEFPPDYLLDQDIILVTLNYRLHILGFFSTSNQASPGNYALKDVAMALTWIKENIADFNGDPKSVTLMGHSAGAGAVHLLALTKKTDGLFNRYILHGGVANAPWNFHNNDILRRNSLRVAELVGCLSTKVEGDGGVNVIDNAVSREDVPNLENDEEMMKCMRTVDAPIILRTILNLNTSVWNGNPYCIFGPALEDNSDDAIVTTHPIKVLRDGLFRDIPVIMEITEDEGLIKSLGLYQSKNRENELIGNFEQYLPAYLEYQEVICDTKTFASEIEDFYFNGNVSLGLMGNITEIVGDAAIAWPTIQALQYQTKIGKSGIYFSLFAYNGTFSHSFSTGSTKHYGICHGDDMNYLFPRLNNLFPDYNLKNSENDNITINIMTEMWANFVREGVPKARTVPAWPNYRDHRRYMKIGNDELPNITVEADFRPGRMEFWEKLLIKVSVDPVFERTGGNADVIDSSFVILTSLVTILLVYTQ